MLSHFYGSNPGIDVINQYKLYAQQGALKAMCPTFEGLRRN